MNKGNNGMQVAMQQLQHAVARLGEENAMLATQAGRNTAQAPAGQLPGVPQAAQEDEGGGLSVQQLRAERRLLKGITRLALAIATDTLTGTTLHS